MKMRKMAAVFTGSLLVAGAAMAELNLPAPQDGDLSYRSSEGEFHIGLKLADRVKIWGLDNFEFVNASLNELETTQSACVHSTTGGFYAYVESGSGDFQLKDTDGKPAADYKLTLATSSGSELSAAWGKDDSSSGDHQEFNSFVSNIAPELPCADSGNVDITVKLYGIITTDAGIYKDKVTITVSPR